jgi:hypothetical protein
MPLFCPWPLAVERPLAIWALLRITWPFASSSGPPEFAGVDGSVGLDDVRDREPVGRGHAAIEPGHDAL